LGILWFLASIVAISGALVAVFLFLLRSTPSVLVVLCLLLSYRQMKLLRILQISIASMRCVNYHAYPMAYFCSLLFVLKGFAQWCVFWSTSISVVPEDQPKQLALPILNSVAFVPQPKAAATFHSEQQVPSIHCDFDDLMPLDEHLISIITICLYFLQQPLDQPVNDLQLSAISSTISSLGSLGAALLAPLLHQMTTQSFCSSLCPLL
jgi:hypothetical protein